MDVPLIELFVEPVEDVQLVELFVEQVVQALDPNCLEAPSVVLHFSHCSVCLLPVC